MLHEVLLALSGHPSPLFRTPEDNRTFDRSDGYVNDGFPDLSASEASMLESLGKLALLHRQLKADLKRLTLTHHSTICRATASSMLYTHLGRFQSNILEFERGILSNDPGLVGAHNIVPLSSVVVEFDQWTRRMQWYWTTTTFMEGTQPVSSTGHSRDRPSSEIAGAALIDYLRSEAQTGYPDIEHAAKELAVVAETAWLKQLSSWILYGQIPQFGSSDFFVATEVSSQNIDHDEFTLRSEYIPKFVPSETASSLYFVGRSLFQLKHYRSLGQTSDHMHLADDRRLVQHHLQALSTLERPLIPSAFARTVAAIRKNLSEKVLQRLLPQTEIERCLKLLREFLLLGRGEFAMALINKADEHMQERQQSIGKLLRDGSMRDLRNITMRDGELAETLAHALRTFVLELDDEEERSLEYAQSCLRLKPNNTPQKSSNTEVGSALSVHIDSVFDDVLFPVKTSLTLVVRPPLDLFLASADVDQYSRINSYLLALRRSHLHLSSLWKLPSARRHATSDQTPTETRRQQEVSSRKVWASCSAAVFFLSEILAYLEGEVVKTLWDHFFAWAMCGSPPSGPSSNWTAATSPTDSSLPLRLDKMNLSSPPRPQFTNSATSQGSRFQHHDPETLSLAHRHFLAHLTYSLLLTDAPLCSSLRSLITVLDDLIANFTRLHQLRDITDQHADSPGFESEESEVLLQLDRARKRTDSGLKSAVERLRVVDRERIGGRGSLTGSGGRERTDMGGYVPCRVGGVDRLLMKLDFGRMSQIDVLDFESR